MQLWQQTPWSTLVDSHSPRHDCPHVETCQEQEQGFVRPLTHVMNFLLPFRFKNSWERFTECRNWTYVCVYGVIRKDANQDQLKEGAHNAGLRISQTGHICVQCHKIQTLHPAGVSLCVQGGKTTKHERPRFVLVFLSLGSVGIDSSSVRDWT